MILAKLYLSPLGAFSKKLIEFAPGMNVDWRFYGQK